MGGEPREGEKGRGGGDMLNRVQGREGRRIVNKERRRGQGG